MFVSTDWRVQPPTGEDPQLKLGASASDEEYADHPDGREYRRCGLRPPAEEISAEPEGADSSDRADGE